MTRTFPHVLARAWNNGYAHVKADPFPSVQSLSIFEHVSDGDDIWVIWPECLLLDRESTLQ